MLDDLLIQIERMGVVIFYWLRGHSGAAPNEAADWHATDFLDAGVGLPIVRGPRRHASMTFAFDRAPFKWAANRIVRHVRVIMRARPSRTEWLGRGDWALTWPGGGDRAHLQKTLQKAQMKRLTLGDEAAFHGAQMDRATRVCCVCNAGPCSTDHWLFDCTLPAAAARRFALLHDVKRVGCRLQVLDGGKEHAATLLTAQALMGQHARGTVERKVAFRWCVGCIPRPVVADKEARGLAVDALTTCARSLVAARATFEESHDGFLEAERIRTLILKSSRLDGGAGWHWEVPRGGGGRRIRVAMLSLFAHYRCRGALRS